MHKTIFHPTQNPELIFSIDPQLIYFTNQLWNAFDRNDVNEWLKYLGMLAFRPNESPYAKGEQLPKKPKYDSKGEIRKAYYEWLEVVQKYIGYQPASVKGFLFQIQNIKDKFLIWGIQKSTSTSNNT